MDLKEVGQLELTNEREHWWIKTRFFFLDRALGLVKNASFKVIEFGCGTCQNMWHLRTQSQHARKIQLLEGIDLNFPDHFTTEWKTENDEFNRQAKGEGYDFAMAMDVLEHIDDDEKALKEWVEKLSTNGIIFITVPAFQFLWSKHDEFLDHKRRYTRKQLLEVTHKCGLEPIECGYIFSHLFFPLYLIRVLLGNNDGKNEQEQASDLQPPFAPINLILILLGKIESIFGPNPWVGTSVIGTFRKK